MPLSTLKNSLNNIAERVFELPGISVLKIKYDELEATKKEHLILGIKLSSAVVFSLLCYFSYSDLETVRTTWEERQSLIHKIQLSKEELARLRERSGSSAQLDGQPWEDYFKVQAQNAGVAPGTVVVSEIKSSKSSVKSNKKNQKSTAAEDLFSIEIPKLNVRQLTHYINFLETGSRIVKIRRMSIEQESEDTGYLKLNFSVSGILLIKGSP